MVRALFGHISQGFRNMSSSPLGVLVLVGFVLAIIIASGAGTLSTAIEPEVPNMSIMHADDRAAINEPVDVGTKLLLRMDSAGSGDSHGAVTHFLVNVWHGDTGKQPEADSPDWISKAVKVEAQDLDNGYYLAEYDFTVEQAANVIVTAAAIDEVGREGPTQIMGVQVNKDAQTTTDNGDTTTADSSADSTDGQEGVSDLGTTNTGMASGLRLAMLLGAGILGSVLLWAYIPGPSSVKASGVAVGLLLLSYFGGLFG